MGSDIWTRVHVHADARVVTLGFLVFANQWSAILPILNVLSMWSPWHRLTTFTEYHHHPNLV